MARRTLLVCFPLVCVLCIASVAEKEQAPARPASGWVNHKGE